MIAAPYNKGRMNLESRICLSKYSEWVDMESRVIFILNTVSQISGIAREEISSKSREGRLITPRHFAEYCLKVYTDLTLKEIAETINPAQPQDHSTVINGTRKCFNLLTVGDAKYISIYNKFKKIVKDKCNIDLTIINPKKMDY